MEKAEKVVGIMPTPNPVTLKFHLDGSLCESVVNFTTPDEAKDVPFVQALFALPEVTGVMVRQDVVSVTKTPEASWEDVSEATQWQSLCERIRQSIESQLALGPVSIPVPEISEEEKESTDSVSQRIEQIINDEIRPAVAMDGGDITFDRFESGTVYLHLKGACSGCPSSVVTLKMGIENRLKEEIPEIKDVVAV